MRLDYLLASANRRSILALSIAPGTRVPSCATNVGVLGTNFATNNLLSLSTQPSTAGVSQGLNVGTARKIDGKYIMTSLANFLQTNGGSNILSRPSLLTLDNEEAKIVVGQNVPFVTGQYTNNNTNNGSVNPFQTVERKDVGLTLKVKPQISDTGTVKLTIDPPNTYIMHIKSGRVKALAVSGKRLASLPNVPTFAEQGMPEFDVRSWYGLIAPAGTPKTVIQKISMDVQEILAQPDVKDKFTALELETMPSSPEQFQLYLRTESEKFSRVVKSANIKAAD
jgi:hypothetical protein